MPRAVASHVRCNFVAYLALFVALGGTSYAALSLPRNSVGSRQIRANSITSQKVKNKSLQANDFKPGQLPAGPRGAKGETGATGPAGQSGQNSQNGQDGTPGTARAYAGVSHTCGGATGPCTITNAKGIKEVRRSGTGTYCVDAPGVDPLTTTAVVSVDWGLTASPPGNASAMIQNNSICVTATGGDGFLVRTERQSIAGSTLNSALASDVAFAVVIP
jgi:hypothetical protein